MEKRYTIGVMIGNANSPHTMNLMQGIFHAAKSMDVNVLLFLGIHSSYYYKSYFGEDTEDDYDYQFNVVYDYQAFADADALIIAYGSLCIFLDEKESKTCIPEAGYGYHKDHTESKGEKRVPLYRHQLFVKRKVFF